MWMLSKSPGAQRQRQAVGRRPFPKQTKLFVGALNAKTAMVAVKGSHMPIDKYAPKAI